MTGKGPPGSRGGLRELRRALDLAHDPQREVAQAAEILDRRLSTLDLRLLDRKLRRAGW